MPLVVIPEGCSISPPADVVRLVPSWEKRRPDPRCDGEHTHDWKMTRGIGCLFVCRHCKACGLLEPTAEVSVATATGPRRFWTIAAGHA